MRVTETIQRLRALGATHLALSPDGERIVIEYEPNAPEIDLLALVQAHKPEPIQALRLAGTIRLVSDPWNALIAEPLDFPRPGAEKQPVEEPDECNFSKPPMTQLTELTQFEFKASGREEKPSKKALTEIDRIDKNPLPPCCIPGTEWVQSEWLPSGAATTIGISLVSLRLRPTCVTWATRVIFLIPT